MEFGCTVEGMTEDEIEMDRTERERMGKLPAQSRLVMQKQQRREEEKCWDVMFDMCRVWPGPSCVSRVAEDVSPGPLPGGKSIRAPGAGEVPHIAIC